MKVLESYKEMTKKKPYLDSILILSGVCAFSVATAYICKVATVGETKNTELVIDETERDYYEGNYDEIIEELKETQEKEKEDWPFSTIKESKIHSLKGDLVMSNSLAEKAYIDSRVALEKGGHEKYKDEIKELSNDIAFTYLINGEVEKAIEYGEILLNEYKDNNELRKTLVTAYSIKGDNPKAIEMLDTIKVDDKDSYGLSELGELNFMLKDYEKGVKYLRRAYEEDNTNINIFTVLDEYSESDILKTYLTDNEKDYIDNIFLARIKLSRDGNCDEVITRVNKIDESKLFKYAMELEMSEKDKDAKRAEALLVELEENHKDTYGGAYILSKVYLNKDDIENATAYANKTIELKPQFGKAYGILFTEILNKNSKDPKLADRVGSYIRDGLEKTPYSVQLIKIAGNYYKGKEDLEIAYKYYDNASKLEVFNAENHINKAMIEAKGEDKELPIKTIENIVKIETNNSDLYNFLGVLYMENNKGDKAIEALRKAYELDKNNAKILNNAAVYYTRYEKNITRAMGNIQEARNISENSEKMLDRDTIIVNYSLIKKVHDEIVNLENQNFVVENLKLLI